ncbi:MAG: xylene monooxygenase, partial [Gammaproteobacteria bacterium]
YWQLTPLPNAPQMPSAWLCILLALIPPLWVRSIQPRLQQWDLQQANKAEQALARQANIAAGWPNWLEQTE